MMTKEEVEEQAWLDQEYTKYKVNGGTLSSVEWYNQLPKREITDEELSILKKANPDKIVTLTEDRTGLKFVEVPEKEKKCVQDKA